MASVDRSPVRTCIGCRRRAPQHELVRIVRRPDGSLAIGRSLEGRGAWLCAGSARCAVDASKRRAFGRAFRATVNEVAVEQLISAFVPEGHVRDTGQPATSGRDDEGAG